MSDFCVKLIRYDEHDSDNTMLLIRDEASNLYQLFHLNNIQFINLWNVLSDKAIEVAETWKEGDSYPVVSIELHGTQYTYNFSVWYPMLELIDEFYRDDIMHALSENEYDSLEEF